MRNHFYCEYLLIAIIVAGCQTTPGQNTISSKQSGKDVANAIGQVADALTGQELTEAQKRKLTKDIQKDKDAQSALHSIAGAMDIKQAAVKYCPVDGKRYSPNLDTCPIHKVKLKELVD